MTASSPSVSEAFILGSFHSSDALGVELSFASIVGSRCCGKTLENELETGFGMVLASALIWIVGF